jgi:hypothetical protein
MSWINGGGMPASTSVTVADVLNSEPPLCCQPGPAWSRCTRSEGHPQPCAALGTDGDGVPLVVTWYRPATNSWPLNGPGQARSR